ncbi:hypothetical protein XELAEV_18019860mg [Xenopus laevis]|uniref:Uncharacterized protein n=1 Tax=Xenopus laevis TaxID=8355 RepID=A0A974D8B5_XENLA|nr:hypothetical protein XELAEV_18019860mg [Xenopus laevis]
MDKVTGERTDLVDTGRRFQWAGYFAEKLTKEGRLILMPICGGCGRELRWGIMEVEGCCCTCKRRHYMGPFYLEQLPPTAEIVDRLVKQLKLQSLVAVMAEPQLLFMTGQEPPEVGESAASRKTQGGDPTGPAAIVTAAGGAPHAVPEPHALNPPTAVASVAPLAVQAKNSADPPVHTEPAAESEDELSASTWREEWEVSDVANDTEASDKGECDPEELPVFPPLLVLREEDRLPEEAHVFWVLPGEAAPKEFRAISKVQRKINNEVHRRWGFYMPYAPRWVYQYVETHLQEWVEADILQYLQLDGKSLKQPDSAARQQAQDEVKGCMARWWMGRTVLQHHVRCVCKRAPERCVSKDVEGLDGATVVKPHPAYYVSHEATKRWFQRML